jgi:GntR family transcriptional regulator, rspAB operon transcriptional repressor
MMKKLVITDNKSIRKKVYSRLRKSILDNEMAPRERLVETKIAKDMGVSRTPVREALQDLEREGLIEEVLRVGYVVRPISRQDLEEICRIRGVLEGLAAGLAIEKAYDRLVRDLGRNILVSEEKIAKGDFKAFVQLGAQFHEIIAKMSRSTRLFELTQLLRRHMLRYRIESVHQTEPALRAIAGHKAILDAIIGRDQAHVCRIIEGHIIASQGDILLYAFKEGRGRENRDRPGI